MTIYSGYTCGMATQDVFVRTNVPLVEYLHTLYDQYQSDFVQYLPPDISLELCKQALINEQEELQERLRSLTYKNTILFSEKNIRRMGLLVAGVAGIAAADLFMHKKLSNVTWNIGSELASDKKYLIGRLQSDLEMGRDADVQAFAPLSALTGHGGSITWAQGIAAESLISQLARKFYQFRVGQADALSYNAYLTLYQIATKALALGAAISGAGLVQDVKSMWERKKLLSERYEKCTKMLNLLG